MPIPNRPRHVIRLLCARPGKSVTNLERIIVAIRGQGAQIPRFLRERRLDERLPCLSPGIPGCSMPRPSKECTGKFLVADTAFTGQTLTKTSARKGFCAARPLHAKHDNSSVTPSQYFLRSALNFLQTAYVFIKDSHNPSIHVCLDAMGNIVPSQFPHRRKPSKCYLRCAIIATSGFAADSRPAM